jgi:proteasome assembly chaperone (PAC2) family protein
MNTDDELRFTDEVPELRKPFLLAGFAGWNDAGQAATYALETLTDGWSATPFAEIEPENFYDFTEARPTISLGSSRQRRLTWPGNTFYAHRMPAQEHDIVVLIGTEPQLRWKTFCRHILSVAERTNASCLVTLGALLADVPHTQPPTLTGFASTSKLVPQLQKLGVHLSTYEGPTGILGALHDAWRRTRRPAVSIWGNVPHYISATPNPQVALALVGRVSLLLGTALPTASLQNHARAFAAQVDEALRENPEALEYVRQLEAQYSEEKEVPEPAPVDAPTLIQELEAFLRTQRPAEDAES